MMFSRTPRRRATDAELIERYRNQLAARQRTRDEIDRAEEREQRRLAEAGRRDVLQSIAAHGWWWPGDAFVSRYHARGWLERVIDVMFGQW